MRIVPGWAQSVFVVALIAALSAVLEVIPGLPVDAEWWKYVAPVVVAIVTALLAWLKAQQPEVVAKAVNMRGRVDRFLFG